jgi:hypothetical protein
MQSFSSGDVFLAASDPSLGNWGREGHTNPIPTPMHPNLPLQMPRCPHHPNPTPAPQVLVCGGVWYIAHLLLQRTDPEGKGEEGAERPQRVRSLIDLKTR